MINGPPLSKCRSCGAGVFFVVTHKRKTGIIDAVPVPHGNIVLEHERNEYIPHGFWRARPPDPLLDGDKQKYISHFATCPHAKDWKKDGKKKEAHEQAEASDEEVAEETRKRR